MINTSITKVKIHEVVRSQIPSSIQLENPNFENFLEQYYISQEYQGGTVDIADNIVEYKSLDFLNNETLTGFTSLTSPINNVSQTIFVDSTKGWPESYGLLKIDNEIITYTGIGSTAFFGCVRGFSGIENNSKTNQPESLTFTSSGISTHAENTRVNNLSNVFLTQFLKKLKKQVLPGFSERKLNSQVNQPNFIRQSTDFYKSKGTEEAFKILFGALYNETVEMIQPAKQMIRPSDADYVVADLVLCEVVSGNPLKIEGQTLTQGGASGSIFRVEKSFVGGKNYFQIGISKGTQIGEFLQTAKTFITKTVGINTTIIDVDSTVSFDSAGDLTIGEIVLPYTSKNYTQFVGVSTHSSEISIGSTVTQGGVAVSYEDGDINSEVRLKILGVINKFNGSAKTQQTGSSINVSTLGIENSEKRFTTWIGNTSARYEINTITQISPNNYSILLLGDHALYTGDTIDIIDIDGNIIQGSITGTPLSDTIRVNAPNIDVDGSYFIRRQLKTKDGVAVDVQNSYSKGQEVYVASNSLPHWQINPQKRIRTFSTAGITTDTSQFTVTDHNYNDGELVYYTSDSVKLTNLLENQPYYVKKIDQNTLALAYTPENVRRGQYITSVVGSDLSGITTHFLTPQLVYNTSIGGQRLLRKFPVPEYSTEKEKTEQGGIGLFANGVEIYSYKSTDKVYYGALRTVDVLNTGSGYDVINRPRLSVSQSGHSGVGASVVSQVSGTITDVLVDTPGVDYQEDPNVTILGGNNTSAVLKPKMKLTPQVVEFDSTTTGGVVDTSLNKFVFKTPHGLKPGEEIIYNTNNTDAIGIGTTPGKLIDNASYFVNYINEHEIHLADNSIDALSGTGVIPISGSGAGTHEFKTFIPRRKVDKILVENNGVFHNRLVSTISGINTYTDTINIDNHGFESGEIVKYSQGVGGIGGLTNEKEYFIIKLTDNSFRVSISTSLLDYVDLTSTGSGEQTFQDPPINVRIEGRQGITTANATATPVIRGSIDAVHVSRIGSEYGSTVINDNFKPSIDTQEGKNAFLQPFIVNGRVDQIIIKYGGNDFFSTPDITITGDGVGAKAKAVVSGGQIVSIEMIEKGAGYTQPKTTVSAKTPGSGAIYSANIDNWTVNQVARYAKSGDMSQDDGFYETATKLGNPYVNYFVPRNLRDFFGDKGVEHSPILGYAYDGHPIYGPLCFKNADGTGGITYLQSSYKPLTRVDGPPTSQYPSGFFIEDYTYVEGLGDLDEHNGRFAITPDYPNGIYAYYTTVETGINGNTNSPFFNVREPQFPYVIGDTYNSKYDSFNSDLTSNQDLDPVALGLVRNTTPHKTKNYEFISNSNKNTKETSKIVSVQSGSIDSITIVGDGENYNVGDKLVFDNTDTRGFGAVGEIAEVVGPGISSISSEIIDYTNIKFVSDGKLATGIFTGAHGLSNSIDVIIHGASDTFDGNHKIKVREVSSGLGTAMLSVGLTTSVRMQESVNKFGINDILKIEEEEFIVFGIDNLHNELDLLRAQNGTVAVAHSYGTSVVRLEKEFKFTPNNNTLVESEVAQYFRGDGDVGVGLTFGVGIGSTVSTLDFGDQFIPNRTIFLPRHPFRDGEKVTYSPGAGTSLTYQTDAMKRTAGGFKRPLPPDVFIKVIDANKVGIVTTLAGISSDLQQVMFDDATGIGNTHSFVSQRSNVNGDLRINEVTVHTLLPHTLKAKDTIDLTVVSAATSTVVATYSDNTRFVSIGSSVNPPISVTTGDILTFDMSSSTLADVNLDFYEDQNFKKEFVGSGKSAIEITSSGVPGDALATKTVRFTKEVPDVLYYNFTSKDSSKIIEIDDQIVDYGKITVNDSKYNLRTGISTVTTNTFKYNLSVIPERVGYTTVSDIRYTTTSKNVTGPIGRILLTSGGSSYKDIPRVSVASTTGSSSDLKAVGDNIGSIDKVNVIDFGFDYPSDRTLKPQAAMPQVFFLKDNFAVDSVGVTSTGNNYLTAPNLVLFNSKTNTVNEQAQFVPEMTGGSVSNVKIIKSGGNLSAGDGKLLAINNTNGVGIISATYSEPTVTLRLKTPSPLGFGSMSFPFSVGDEVFVENLGVTTGNGYNSVDYNYQYFTLTGVTTNPGQVNQALISYDVPSAPGVHDYGSYGTVANKKDIAQFDLTLIESVFVNNEIIYSGDNEARVILGDGKTTNVLRVDSVVGFNTGDQIIGKISNGGGTIESIESYSGDFDTGVSVEKIYGWEKDTGKLNQFNQRIQDSDYYQNFAYSLKSFVGISSWSEPVDSLAHIGGFKKHSDLLISSAPIGIGTTATITAVGTAGTSVILIDNEAKVYERHDHDTGYELPNAAETISDQVVFKHSRFGDSLLCKTNRVLEIDDISPQFYSDPDKIREVEIDTFDSSSFSAVKYYAQVVLDSSLGVTYNATQYCEFIVTHDNDRVYINQYSDLSDAFDLGEFQATISGTTISVSFTPFNASFTYDVTFHKEGIPNSVSAGTTAFAHIEKTGISSAFTASGSPSTVVFFEVDATKFQSGDVLVVHNGSGQKEIEEYSFLCNGANSVDFTDYTNIGTGVTQGNFDIDMSSNVIQFKYTPVAGIGVTIQTLTTLVGIATTVSSVSSNIMSLDIGDSELNATRTTIGASGSPSATIVSTKAFSNYTSMRYTVEIENVTDSKRSVFKVSANSFGGNANFAKYNNISNASDQKRDIRNTEIILSSGNVVMTFLPLANKSYVVRTSEIRIDKPDNIPNDTSITL